MFVLEKESKSRKNNFAVVNMSKHPVNYMNNFRQPI